MNVRFGGNAVLRDIHLAIPAGQTLAVIGESGCGKTVFLKTLIGLIRPTGGSVLFDGRPLSEMSDKQLTQERVRFGFVFQNAALFDSLTVGQNVAFPLREHRRLGKRRGARHRAPAPGRSRTPQPGRQTEARRAVGRHAQASRAGQSPGARTRSGPVRRAYHRAGSHYERHHQRTHDAHATRSDQHRIVTHDMRTARKVADRVVMLYPLSRLDPDEPQVIYDGPPSQLDHSSDRRVTQFIRGEAGERLMELRQESAR